MVTMSGGEALVKSLVREGVEVVFGIPGIQIYGIIAALRDEAGIRMVTTRHEQATTYMADGYARASGKPGVALVVPGAGLYNAASGLTNAYSPVLPSTYYRGPNPARCNRQEPRRGPRSRRPVRHGAFRDQVAAAGIQAPGGAGYRVRSVPADTNRPASPRSD